MKIKPLYIVLVVVFVIVIGLPLGAFLALNHLAQNSKITPLSSVEDPYGVSEGMVIQDEGITDIRMTVVPREYKVPDDLEHLVGGEGVDVQYLQVYYGYCLDGVWHDYPSENYDLIDITHEAGERGWKLSYHDHMVKIGPYLLISIIIPGYPDMTCEVSDSLGSELLNPFMEYVSSGYGFVAFDPSGEDSCSSYSFWPRYYLLLEFDSLPDDYVLTVNTEMSSYTDEYSVTRDEIVSWVNGEGA